MLLIPGVQFINSKNITLTHIVLLVFPIVGLVNSFIIEQGSFQRYITSLFQYMLLSMPLVLMQPVYAMLNLHDASWGTKGVTNLHIGVDLVKSKKLQSESFKQFRTIVVLAMVILNAFAIYLVIYFHLKSALIFLLINWLLLIILVAFFGLLIDKSRHSFMWLFNKFYC